MPQPRVYENSAQRQAAYRQRVALARAQQLQARRLPPLPALPAMPGWARWRRLIQDAYRALQLAADEMAQYADDRSERWQESERAEAFQERLDAVLELLEAVEQFGADYKVPLAEPGG
jgi:hypothetical protein